VRSVSRRKVGRFLTCSHYIGKNLDKWKANRHGWFLIYMGQVLVAECHVRGAMCELALREMIAVELQPGQGTPNQARAFIRLCSMAPAVRISMICIRQPGRGDLKTTSARKMKYKLIELSEGIFRSMVSDRDHHNSSTIERSLRKSGGKRFSTTPRTESRDDQGRM